MQEKHTLYQEANHLRNYWYAACQSTALQPGKVTDCTIMEQPIALWRDAQGKVHALVDRCPHRNAPLSKGRVVDNCLMCPYHGWTYDGNGTCVDVPSEPEGYHNRVGKAAQAYHVMERHGLVWVWMGTEAPDKEPFPMPDYKGNGWVNYYMVTDFEHNVTELVENFMDVPHTVFVHEGWFRDRKKMPVKARVERTLDSVLVTYDQPKDSIGFTGKLLNPKGLPMHHTDKFYMPNVTRVDYVFGEEERAFIITSTCTPIAQYKSRVYTLITYKFGWMNALARLGLPWYTKKVIMQDVWIMQMVSDSMKRFETHTYRSTPADTMHVFIEQLREAAERRDAPPKPITTEIEFWI